MMADDAHIVTIRGSGGATFEVTIPAEGTHRRELFDAQLARGEISIDEPEAKAAGRRAKPVDAVEQTEPEEG